MRVGKVYCKPIWLPAEKMPSWTTKTPQLGSVTFRMLLEISRYHIDKWPVSPTGCYQGNLLKILLQAWFVSRPPTFEEKLLPHEKTTSISSSSTAVGRMHEPNNDQRCTAVSAGGAASRSKLLSSHWMASGTSNQPLRKLWETCFLNVELSYFKHVDMYLYSYF